MSRWVEQFKNHELHKTLSEAYELVSKEFEDFSADEQMERRRLLKVLSIFQHALSKVDPDLVSTKVLDGINNSLKNQNFWAHIRNYNNTGKAQHLVSANNGLNKQLDQFNNLVLLLPDFSNNQYPKELDEAFDNVVGKFDQRKSKLEEEVSGFSKLLSEKQNRLV